MFHGFGVILYYAYLVLMNIISSINLAKKSVFLIKLLEKEVENYEAK